MASVTAVIQPLPGALALRAACFCFLVGGPRPSKAASRGVLTERSITLRPAHGHSIVTRSDIWPRVEKSDHTDIFCKYSLTHSERALLGVIYASWQWHLTKFQATAQCF